MSFSGRILTCLALVASLCVAEVFGSWLETLEESSPNGWIAWRQFSNGSFAILDLEGVYRIMSQDGLTEVWKLKIELPRDLTYPEIPAVILGASIDESSTIYLHTNLAIRKFSEGQLINIANTTTSSTNNILTSFPLGLNHSVAYDGAGLSIFQLNNDNFARVYYNSTFGTENDITTMHRLVPNRWTGRLYIQTLGRYIFSVDLATYTFTQLYVGSLASVTSFGSSLGATSTYMFFTVYRGVDGDKDNIQDLYAVNSGTLTVTTESNIVDYSIASLTAHPTLNEIVFMTADGVLYRKTYTTSPSFVWGTTVLLTGDLFNSALEMEFLSDTQVLVKGPSFMGVYNYPAFTKVGIYLQSPIFATALLGTQNLFLLHPQRLLDFYSKTTHSVERSLHDDITVRQVLVSRNAASPFYFVMGRSKVHKFSSAPANIGNAALSTLDLTVLFTSGSTYLQGYTTFITLDDIEIFKLMPTILQVMVFAYNPTSALKRMLILPIDMTSFTIAGNAFVPVTPNSPKSRYSSLVAINNPTQTTQFAVVFVYGTAYTYTVDATYTYTYVQRNAPGFVLAGSAARIASRRTYYQHVFKAYPHKTPEGTAAYLSTVGIMAYVTINGAGTGMTVTGVNPLGIYRPQITDDEYFGEYTSTLIQVNQGFLVKQNFTTTRIESNKIFLSTIPCGVPYQGTDGKLYITTAKGVRRGVNAPATRQNGEFNLTAGKFIFSPTPTPTNCEEANFISTFDCSICNAGYQKTNSQCTSCATTSMLSFNQSCVSSCPLDTYKDATKAACQNATDIAIHSKFIFGSQAVSSCPANSGLNPTPYCICTNSAQFPNADSTACVTSCAASSLYWDPFGVCVDASSLPTISYTQNSTNAYCDPNTHYYDLNLKKCTLSCTNKLTGTHPTYGKLCTDSTACIGTAGYFIDLTKIPNKCVAACGPFSLTHPLEKACKTTCPVTTPLLTNDTIPYFCGTACINPYLLSPAGGHCIKECSMNFYNSSCFRLLTWDITSVTESDSYEVNVVIKFAFASDGSTSPELVDMNPFDITNLLCSSLSQTASSCTRVKPTKEAKINGSQINISVEINRNFNETQYLRADLIEAVFGFADKQRVMIVKKSAAKNVPTLKRLLDDASVAGTAAKSTSAAIYGAAAALPALASALSSVFDVSIANTLILLMEVSKKLALTTYFSFELKPNYYSSLYYTMMNSFEDMVKDKLDSIILGTDRVNELQQNVCVAGWDRFCALNTMDNFMTSNFISLFATLGGAGFLGLVWLYLWFMRKRTMEQRVMRELKYGVWINAFYSQFLMGSVSLILNLCVTTYRDPIFGTLKAFGILVLVGHIYLIGCIMRYTGKSLEENKSHFLKLLMRYYSESVKPELSTNYVKFLLSSEVLFVIFVMLGKVMGKYHMALIIGLELLNVYFIFKYKVFKSRMQHWSLGLISALFALLVMAMFIGAFFIEDANFYQSQIIFLLTAVICMSMVICFIIEAIMAIVTLIKKWRQARSGTVQDTRTLSYALQSEIRSPHRAPRMKFLTKSPGDKRIGSTLIAKSQQSVRLVQEKPFFTPKHRPGVDNKHSTFAEMTSSLHAESTTERMSPGLTPLLRKHRSDKKEPGTPYIYSKTRKSGFANSNSILSTAALTHNISISRNGSHRRIQNSPSSSGRQIQYAETPTKKKGSPQLSEEETIKTSPVQAPTPKNIKNSPTQSPPPKSIMKPQKKISTFQRAVQNIKFAKKLPMPYNFSSETANN